MVALSIDGKWSHLEATYDATGEDDEPLEKPTAWSRWPVGVFTVRLVLWCRQQRWLFRLANPPRYDLTVRLVLWCRIQRGGGGLPDLAGPSHCWLGGQFVVVLDENGILAERDSRVSREVRSAATF